MQYVRLMCSACTRFVVVVRHWFILGKGKLVITLDDSGPVSNTWASGVGRT